MRLWDGYVNVNVNVDLKTFEFFEYTLSYKTSIEKIFYCLKNIIYHFFTNDDSDVANVEIKCIKTRVKYYILI